MKNRFTYLVGWGIIHPSTTKQDKQMKPLDYDDWAEIVEAQGLEIVCTPFDDSAQACDWVKEGNKYVNKSSAYWTNLTNYNLGDKNER